MKGFVAVLCALAFCACNRVDLPEAEKDKDKEVIALPIGVGEGTSERPWTVEQVLKGAAKPGKAGWVIGYAVGAVYQTLENPSFETDLTYTSNIILASDSLCEDATLCVPVELSTKVMKEGFSIPYNQDCLHQCVMMHGMVGTYFKTKGLRTCDTGLWLMGFDISSISSLPEEWHEVGAIIF